MAGSRARPGCKIIVKCFFLLDLTDKTVILSLMNNELIVCDTPDKILAFQLLATRSALKMEIIGLRHSRGSVAQKVREMMGVKTRDKEKLLAIFNDYLKVKGFLS